MKTISWKYPVLEQVLIGADAATAVRAEAERLDRRRVVLFTSRSVAGTAFFDSVVDGLGCRFAASFEAISAPASLRDVLSAAAVARAASADLVVAVGGGAVIDGAKVALICLRHAVTEPAELLEYRGMDDARHPGARPGDEERWTRLLTVSTTLSAAEFTWWGGAYDPERGVKEPYGHPLMMARNIVLDPAATLTAPTELLLATGMKAVDHAAERITTLRSEPLSEARAVQSLRMLARGLRAVRADPTDLEARLLCQTGMAVGMASPVTGAGVGASHAIGHVLGWYGVSHGHTSCTVLPAVMRWNREVNGSRQALIAEAMDRPGEEAGDVLEEFVAELALPTRLRDVGATRADFLEIAKKVLNDRTIGGNARRIDQPEQILEILEMAW